MLEKPIRRKPKKQEKTINGQKVLIIAGCVIGAVALIIAACFLFGDKPQKEEPGASDRISMPELTVGEVVRREQSMVVQTSYLDVAYPYAFSDLIYVVAVNEDTATALEFRVKTSSMDEKLYTVWFNGTTGEQVGSFNLKDSGKKVPVMVVFYGLPAGLSEDDQGTFKATQETFNDVLASLAEDPSFS